MMKGAFGAHVVEQEHPASILPIPNAIEQLKKSNDYLLDQLCQLCERLHPVLIPRPESNGKAGHETSAPSPLAQTIEAEAERTNAMASRVREMIESLAL